jgi:hypothetical protein
VRFEQQGWVCAGGGGGGGIGKKWHLGGARERLMGVLYFELALCFPEDPRASCGRRGSTGWMRSACVPVINEARQGDEAAL